MYLKKSILIFDINIFFKIMKLNVKKSSTHI